MTPELMTDLQAQPYLVLPHWVTLTPRELEVMRLVIEGESDKAIARQLGIQHRTVLSYAVAIYRKCGVHSRTQLLLFALRSGLFDLDELRHPHETNGVSHA